MKSIDKYLFPNMGNFRGKSPYLDYGHRLNSNTKGAVFPLITSITINTVHNNIKAFLALL